MNPKHATIFHDFMFGEVWADHCEPAPGGGTTMYATLLYDEWHDAFASAQRVGATPDRPIEDDGLDGPGTMFRFADGSELAIADHGGAMLPAPGPHCERVIILTREAHNAVRGKAEHGFNDTSMPLPDGNAMVPLGADTAARIAGLSLEGESFSDTLIRILTIGGGKLQ